MSTVRYLVGDVRDRVEDIADGSVSLIVTSPPFLALRSYLPADHPMKHAEIGSEPDPAAFIDCLLAQVAQWSRKLASWGTICVELGDTYAGSGGAGGDYVTGGLRDSQPAFDGSGRRPMGGWPEAKSVCWIPESFGIALAYGINPLTGQASPAGRWLVRNKIVWARPNPPVGALGDKFRPATSLIVVATRDPRRWFDLDAVRTEHKEGPPSETTAISRKRALNRAAPGNHTENADVGIAANPAGAPPLDWHIDGDHDGWDVWRMSTQPYPGSHYATFPAELPRRLIASMCPAEVCATCGTPRRPRYVRVATFALDGTPTWQTDRDGWSDCGHDDYTPGTVLDPFAGSGTTLAVAAELGRDAIGVDIDDRNVALARKRVGEHAHVRDEPDGTWTCEPRLPNQAAQIDGQISMFGGEA